VYLEALKLKLRIGAPPGEILCKFALFHMEKNKLAKTQESPEQGAYKADPKDLSKAKDLIETAEKEITSEQKIDSMLLTYVKGRFLLDQDPQKAIGQFAALKTQAEASGVRRFSFLASVGLGLAHESLKNWEEAARAFQQAVDYAEYIRNTLDPHERLSFLDGEEILGMKHVVPYKGLSRVLMKRGDSDQSLMWAEYTKARAFSESLARRWEEASFNMPKEVLDKDFDLETKLSGLIRAVEKAYEQGATDAVHSLQQDIEKFSAERKRHVDELRQKFPLYAATKYPQPTPLNRAALKESELVLEYDVTDSGVLIFLTRGNHLTKAIFKPVPGFQVDELVRRFREPLEIVSGKDDPADKLKSFDFEAGRKLASLLVEDVLAELPEQTPVTIVPDGSLGMLPFEMLMLSSEGQVTEEGEFPTVTAAVFFGDRNPISYSQSITALTLARTLGRKEKPSDRLLVMADPVFEQRDARALHARPIMMAEADKQFSIAIMNALEETSGGFKFNRLPLTGEMASHLNEIFEQNSDVYTGLKASKKNFLKDVGLRLEGYGNLVLGTHGFFSKDNPHFREPILVLTLVPVGTDGFLRMTEVTGLKLNCDLVALVACQTGLGRHISGEGTIGMGRAFQYAGARSVLMSLWSVPEISSVKLVENFFKYTKAGKNKLEALQMARADIRQEGFNHPFFWASFILVGEIE
jgi:tetratricopeptide (TPR) repeat protein